MYNEWLEEYKNLIEIDTPRFSYPIHWPVIVTDTGDLSLREILIASELVTIKENEFTSEFSRKLKNLFFNGTVKYELTLKEELSEFHYQGKVIGMDVDARIKTNIPGINIVELVAANDRAEYMGNLESSMNTRDIIFCIDSMEDRNLHIFKPLIDPEYS